MTHKAICYDDEGRLECCCELRPMLETRNSPQPKEATHETD